MSMPKNFSARAIAAVIGKKPHTIYDRSKVLGIKTGRKGYSAEQAHALIYYKPAVSTRLSRHETLEQECDRLRDTLCTMNAAMGKQTVLCTDKEAC